VCKRGRGRHRHVTRCVKLAVNDGVQVGKGAAGKPQKVVAKAGGDWQVQLGAYKSSALARHELAAFNQKFAEELTPAEGHVDHASGNYRVRFAGLSADRAREACASIKSQGHDCMTLRP
jgi:D-alanyl-D-alanine carboxypeptidase